MTNPKWLKLSGELLDLAADQFANHGCNDWDWPEDWTEEERREFTKAYHDWNGDPQEYDPDRLALGDWMVMMFLADRLKGAVTP